LYLTGTHNHDWKRSAPFCKRLLESTGRFSVQLIGDPPERLLDRRIIDTAGLFVVDYNGPDWNRESRGNFIDAVRRGKGVCILHGANNGFEGWTEYEDMCGLMWREGSGHGKYHRFDVRIVDTQHPVTRGLGPVLKNHPDELYHRLVRMHNAQYTVLAEAYSSPESGGTGNHEPMVVVRKYGQGRVFHCILGHVWPGGGMETFENEDFQRLFVRGCEWAATGTVSE